MLSKMDAFALARVTPSYHLMFFNLKGKERNWWISLTRNNAQYNVTTTFYNTVGIKVGLKLPSLSLPQIY